MAGIFNIIQAVEILEEVENDHNNLRVQTLQDRTDPFEYPDKYFKKIYRLNKPTTAQLIDALELVMPAPNRLSAITIKNKVLTTLNFLASGSYQMSVARNVHQNMSQPSVSRCISEVVAAINAHMFQVWVKFDLRPQSVMSMRQRFYEKHNFPGAIAAVDGTHVSIAPPQANHPLGLYREVDFFNHKGFHSLNVQLACDADMKIINVNARYPGSVHDSFIFRNSNLRLALQAHEVRNPQQKIWLLGDSGYALETFLMTPVPGNVPQHTPQGRYNSSHRSARNVIERCIGVLKSRWRCLLKHRVLHYAPSKASEIIKTCTVLHNICVANDIELDDDLIWDEDLHVENDIPDAARGQNLRNQIIQRYFS